MMARGRVYATGCDYKQGGFETNTRKQGLVVGRLARICFRIYRLIAAYMVVSIEGFGCSSGDN
jgi:hypothetical protein